MKLKDFSITRKITFKYISVDVKSIKAVKEGHFWEIYQARNKLEKENKGTVLCLRLLYWYYKLSVEEFICQE